MGIAVYRTANELHINRKIVGFERFFGYKSEKHAVFYETWQHVIPESENRQLITDELATNQLPHHFISVGFTHHIAIVNPDFQRRLRK
jgi:hypothetical protein